MKYKEIRPLIKSGDILAWSHRGWKSWYDIKIQFVRMAQLNGAELRLVQKD